MKRLAWFIWHAAAGLSLLLCVASAMLWVRGQWREDGIFLERHGRAYADPTYQSQWSNTTMGLAYQQWAFISGVNYQNVESFSDKRPEYRNGYTSKWSVYSIRAPVLHYSPQSIWNHLGFYKTVEKNWATGVVTFVSRSMIIILPHWFITLAMALLPAAQFTRIFRQRRARRHAIAGLCKTCGYDLRATPDRCPECGAVPI